MLISFDSLYSHSDVSYHLSDDVIRTNHPEAFISYTGERSINNPKGESFEFTGKSAGRVKCTYPKSAKKCAEYIELFESIKMQQEHT